MPTAWFAPGIRKSEKITREEIFSNDPSHARSRVPHYYRMNGAGFATLETHKESANKSHCGRLPSVPGGPRKSAFYLLLVARFFFDLPGGFVGALLYLPAGLTCSLIGGLGRAFGSS